MENILLAIFLGLASNAVWSALGLLVKTFLRRKPPGKHRKK